MTACFIVLEICDGDDGKKTTTKVNQRQFKNVAEVY
jgi:hypothetical protein